VTAKQWNYNRSLQMAVERYETGILPRRSNRKPKYMTDDWVHKPKTCSFCEARSGIFSKESAYMTEGPLPRVVFACDPGIVNPWCISKIDTNPNMIDTRQEARQVINLTRKQYNTEIGLTYFNKTLNRKKDQERYQDALIRLSRNSLKGVFMQDFDARYLETRAGYEILRKLYSSRNFGKLRFRLHSQKQKFDRVYVNKALRIFEEEAGGNDYVVAYGDGQFPLTMKGCGSSAHGRLMRLLSKRVRVVMTNEYWTTKACPKCRDKTSSMR